MTRVTDANGGKNQTEWFSDVCKLFNTPVGLRVGYQFRRLLCKSCQYSLCENEFFEDVIIVMSADRFRMGKVFFYYFRSFEVTWWLRGISKCIVLWMILFLTINLEAGRRNINYGYGSTPYSTSERVWNAIPWNGIATNIIFSRHLPPFPLRKNRKIHTLKNCIPSALFGSVVNVKNFKNSTFLILVYKKKLFANVIQPNINRGQIISEIILNRFDYRKRV